MYELFPNEMHDKLLEVLELKGDTLYGADDFDAAVELFQECIDFLSPDEKEDDDSKSQESQHVYDERAARVFYKMGHAFAKLEEYEQAFDSYREAIAVFSHELGETASRLGT